MASGGSPKLDRYDVAILRILQMEGRISKRELAERIGLSVSPCWVRIRKLEDAGYIRGYNAKIDYEKIARFCYVTTLVSLDAHHAQAFRLFERAIADTPEVVSCEAVIGEVDYILRFVTVDIDHYQRVIERLLDADIGIRVYFSHVRSKTIKRNPRALLEHLLNELAQHPSG